MQLSPRLKFQLPEVSTDSMADGNDVLGHNYDLIDLNAHCRVVNVKADVTDPFEGQHIHTLSDGLNFVRKNGIWDTFAEISAPAGAGGSKGTAGTIARQILTNNSIDVLVTSITFTPEVGKRYLVKASVSLGVHNSTSIAIDQIRLRWAVGTTVTTAGTLIAALEMVLAQAGATNDQGNPSDRSITLFDEIFPNNTTQLTVGLFVMASSSGFAFGSVNPPGSGAGVGFETYSNLSVTDWGS